MKKTLHVVATFINNALFSPTDFKIASSVILSILFFFFGNIYTEALIAILMLMILDTILGVAAAIYEKPVGVKILSKECLNSRRFSRVVIKGMVYFSAISAGYFADLTIPFDVIQATMIAFIGATEFISVLENMGRLGYPTPKNLLERLKQLRDSK